MKKINFIAVAFTAILSQSANASTGAFFPKGGKTIGTDNIIILKEKSVISNGILIGSEKHHKRCGETARRSEKIFIWNNESDKRRAETAYWSNDAKKKYRNILPEENGRREKIYTDCSVGC